MNSNWKPGRFIVKKSDAEVRVPDFILESSAFVVSIAAETLDELHLDFEGSGFLVGIRSERCSPQSFFYFVTTAHTLKPGRRYGIRFNLKAGGVKVTEVETWYSHPTDPKADISIAQFANIYEDYAIQFIGEEIFRPKNQMDDLHIGIGDEVYFPGLFTWTQQESDQKNLPILRMGNIVMLPNEKVQSEVGLMDAYLVEARSLGGISGAPVFSRRTISMLWNDGEKNNKALHGLTGEVHLIGMMHGHWDVKESEINQARIQPIDHGHRQGVNMGIGLVIPVSKIIETLYRSDLIKMRQEKEEQWLRQKHAQTGDLVRSGKMEVSSEYDTFTSAVDRILSIPKDEILRREESYRKQAALNPRKRGPKPKRKRKPSASPGPVAG